MTSFASVWGRVGVGAAVAALGGASFLFACAEKTAWDEDVVGEGLTKGTTGAVNGAADYCDSPTNLCVAGEGDCDSDSQCTGGTVCGVDNGPNFGMGVAYDVCAMPHCRNGLRDADEPSVDCGGVDCGSNCTWKCTNLPANGQLQHCNIYCPCPNHEGNCNIDTECAIGLKCMTRVGADYGFTSTINVCEYAHCRNKVKDVDETGIDCGGSCVPCTVTATGTVRFGGATSDFGSGIFVRMSNGEYAIVYRFNGSASFGGSTFTAVGGTDIAVAKYSINGVHMWSKSFGSPPNDGDQGVAVAIGPSGQVAVVGNYGGAMTVAPGVTYNSVSGSYDGFIVVYDTNGNYLWSRSVGGSDLDRLLTVAFDTDGSVVVGGSFKGTSDFGKGSVTSAGDHDAVLAKYSSTGTPTWVVTWGGTGFESATAVVRSSDYNFRVAGEFSKVATFGSTTLTSKGGSDIYVARVAPATGAITWIKQFGGTGTDRPNAVTVGATSSTANQVFVAGGFGGSVDFGGGAVTAVGSLDAFVLALNTDGTYKWVKTGGGTGGDEATAITSSFTSGEIIVGGYLTGTVSNLLSSAYTAAGSVDAFFTRYQASDGALISGAAYGSTGADVPKGISATSNSAAMVTGYFSGNMTVGFTPLVVQGPSDAFVTKLTR